MKTKYHRVTTDNKWLLVYVLAAFMTGLLVAGVFIKSYSYFKSINRPQALLSPLDGIGSLVVGQVYAKGVLTEQEEIAQYICSKPWDCKKALKIARCESGLNPLATNKNKNGTVDRGILQINSIHGLRNSYDWKTNIDFAIQKLYTLRGWKDWASSYKCHGIK